MGKKINPAETQRKTSPNHSDFKNSLISTEKSGQLLAKALLAAKVANIGLWEYVFEKKQIIADDIFFSHFGTTISNVNGNYKVLWKLVNAEDKAGMREAYKKAVCEQGDLSFECSITWQDGSLHHIKVNAVFHSDATGKPCSLIGTCQDLTAQTKTLSALQESEAKFRTFYQNIPDALLLTVTDGNILAANPAACKIFQMTEAEICANGRFGLVDLSDPKVNSLIEERARNGWAKGETTCIRKDGTKFPVEITSVVFTDASGKNRTSMMIRDLSETRNIEKNLIATSDALQYALHGLEKIMDSSLDMICTVNEEGKFVTVSAASARILGYTPDELINTRFIDLVLKEDVEKTLETDASLMHGAHVTLFENRYVHKDGRIVPLLWSAKWDENDKLNYCIAKDVTEKKKLEKAIELERQRFMDIYSQAPSCMGIIKGPNYVYEMANPLYLQLIGKTDIIGKTVKEVLPELESQGLFDFLDNVYNTGKTFSANEMLVKFDLHGTGQLVDTYLNFIYQAHRDIGDNIDGIFFFAVDVTEQVLSRKKIEESEKQYRQIVETAQEGIWVIDENDRTTFVNKKLCDIFEYSEEEMLGRAIYDFTDDEGKKLAATQMLKKRQGKSSAGNFKYISKSGKEIWTNISANPLFKEDNSYDGSLAMVTDITERILLEKKLFDEQINSQKEITKAAINAQEKERTEIGQELHDNVNQLLTTTNLYLGHFLKNTGEEFPLLIKGQKYLLAAIEDIRNLTKALVGPNENDIGLVESIDELISSILLIRHVQINFAHDTYSDQDSENGLKLVMYRIIQEQLNNILKHSGATHVTISIEHKDNCLSLLISDNGKGFDTASLRNGIGLKNIRHRAQIYNGEVTISSSPGNGCAVAVIFPKL